MHEGEVYYVRKKLVPLKVLLVMLAVILSRIALLPVSANDGVLGVTPDGVYPITQSDIMMVSEEIYIHCATGKVTCRFDFKNLGDAQTVVMGFPARLNENLEYESFTTEEDVTIRNFTARDEKGEISVSLADTIPNPPLKNEWGMEAYSKWYTFSVDFEKQQEKTLYHTYKVNFPYYSNGEVVMGYVIETGALWKGPIGHSKVIFDMGEIPMYSLSRLFPLNYYRIEGQKLIFERREFKPEYNLSVVKNEQVVDLEWLKNVYGEPDSETRAFIDQRLEIFKESPEAIRKNSQAYLVRYQELINQDPISALYIKSALGLLNGSEKPANASLRILKQTDDVWEYEVSATDSDGDIIGFETEYKGLEQYGIENYSGGMYYQSDNKRFTGRGILNLNGIIDPSTTSHFAITVTIKDSAGYTDTATLLLEPEPSATPEETPYKAPRETSTPSPTSSSNDSENALHTYQPVNKGERVIPMEEETMPLLIAGVALVLSVSFIVITLLFIKRKSRGYLLFVAQLIVIGLSFYQLIELLNTRNTTEGIMNSEIISGKIGLIAILWVLSMLLMLVGIIITGKNKTTKVN